MAGKFIKKGGGVRKFASAGVLLMLLISIADAESINRDSDDFDRNILLLSSRCGYRVGESVLDKISKSSSKINDRIILIDLYVLMRLEKRLIQGKLSFGCFAVRPNISKQDKARRLTAGEEIAQADSGGRYSHDLVWQRRYEGSGWSGTVAYVSSVFGDQENLSVSDYFLICPDKDGLACFSFEILGARLNEGEADQIPVLLDGIGVAK
ncbi:hypothetical protein [Burkholderia ubonensis]|uniref:hypothetical protein n=1 Tax=Burkholderia ubonensis TaxID=101571 RepID=UPI0012FA74D5|nr:hypothetical protein [Burkholderia ubonensis]